MYVLSEFSPSYRFPQLTEFFLLNALVSPYLNVIIQTIDDMVITDIQIINKVPNNQLNVSFQHSEP